MLLFNQYRPEVVLIRNWATGWELRVSVSLEEACNLLRPEYTHWNSGTPDCDHDVNSSKQNNKVGCSTYVGKKTHCKEPANLYFPSPTISSWKGWSFLEGEGHSTLCFKDAYASNLAHLPTCLLGAQALPTVRWHWPWESQRRCQALFWKTISRHYTFITEFSHLMFQVVLWVQMLFVPHY